MLEWRVPTWSSRSGLLYAILVALLLRGGIAWLRWNDLGTDPDIYLALARQLAAGQGYVTPETETPTAFRPPGYALGLAALLLIPGMSPSTAVLAVNWSCDLGTLCCLAVWLRRYGVSSSVLLPSLMVLVADPLLLRYSVLPMTESFFTFWATVAVTLVMMGDSPRSTESFKSCWGMGVAAGLATGIALLTRPTFWPWFAAVAVIRWVSVVKDRWHGKPLRSDQTPGSRQFLTIWTAVTLLTVAPWVVRNRIELGHVIVTTTHGGYTLLLGNNPVFYRDVARQPWGTVWSGEGLAKWQAELADARKRDLGASATEVEVDRWESRLAVAAIWQDPQGFVQAVLYRIRSLWSLAPRGPAAESSRAVNTAVAMWYAVVFLLAIAGLFDRTLWSTPGGWYWMMLLLTVQGLHLFYWTDTRMRVPLSPWIALMAGVALQRCWARMTRVRGQR